MNDVLLNFAETKYLGPGSLNNKVKSIYKDTLEIKYKVSTYMDTLQIKHHSNQESSHIHTFRSLK